MSEATVPTYLFVAPLGTQPPSTEWAPVGFCSDFAFEPVKPMMAWEAIRLDTTRTIEVEGYLVPPKARREKRSQQRALGLFCGVRNWRAWKARRRRIATQMRRVERRARRRRR